jgi:hypothetical protein
MAEVPIRAAAEHFGVSVDTIRRRIERGELTARKKDPTDVRSPWLVEIPDADPEETPHPTTAEPRDAELERALHYAAVLEAQLEARTREVAELHQLLASRMLPARIEDAQGSDTASVSTSVQDDGASTGQPPTQGSASTTQDTHTRPWWKFWETV